MKNIIHTLDTAKLTLETGDTQTATSLINEAINKLQKKKKSGNGKQRLGSYPVQYKLTDGLLKGRHYTALTANTLLDTTRLTNNIIQCERDGLEIIHERKRSNEGKSYTEYYIDDVAANIRLAHKLKAFYALKAGVKEAVNEMPEAA